MTTQTTAQDRAAGGVAGALGFLGRKGSGATALAALALLFVGLTILITFTLRGARLDLTESRLYSIAPGTRNILASLDEPINLYFFFSEQASRNTPQLRAYAQRVRELLEEMAQRSDGKLRLSVIDPQPFTEEEDRAAEFGLSAVPTGTRGESLYFGLAGTNSTDGRETIGFFQPDREEFLEYDVTSLIYRLDNPKRPVVGLMSSLPLDASFDHMSGRMREGWTSIAQLREMFTVRTLGTDIESIAEDIDVLMLVHPKDLPPKTAYAIDQFVMRGGKLMAFLDPQAENDSAGAQFGPAMTPRASSLEPLLSSWGVEFDPDVILGDRTLGLTVAMRAGEPPAQHIAIVGFDRGSMNAEDVVTSSLDTVNVMTAGAFKPKPAEDGAEGPTFEPLILSSENAALLPSSRFAFLENTSGLLDGFQAAGERYAVAARVSGKLKSAFPNGHPDAENAEGASPDHLAESNGEAHLILVADTDILSDPLWVRTQSVFGQRFAVAWANNGDFLANAVDNLTGSGDLISVRARQSFFRPFTKVEELRRAADERLRAKEKELDEELRETERKLAELEAGRSGSESAASALMLSPEQEAELQRFQQERLRIRKELREVRRSLDVEIERLGSALKFLNIAFVPLLLSVGALGLEYTRRRKLTAGRKAAARTG
ncbi:MAG: hypothetical protein DIU71_02425 [Proteobacteria bacterium]|nr:MAG: hypothetical protein DIU71_02425 [Pseudomonadota bacterium]